MQKWMLFLSLAFFQLFAHLAIYGESYHSKHPVVVFETTQGNFEVTLFPDLAPKAVENFLTHAKESYYNGTSFHRVIKGFMIQGGDPEGNGTGGQSIWGKPFADEFHPDRHFDHPGILAMANRGPHTNGSQFFITTAKTPWLDQKHTIFGEVTKGYEIVQKIEGAQTDAQNRPLVAQKIIKISLKR
ncbi:peptidylprolyl isomerase [Neochlamydia sp. EPS4]|uniref:peptidylprolyl isomerase n=1 Tax=Neochlamydia sp. EPS4 TaxID=1478175 RepID=UPI000A6D3B64|nr:peptidylprolyl isomerase [Neochlamydia sp. EPS4]